MPTHNYKLLNPPEDEREKALWLQQAAGFIFMQDVREYALEQLAGKYDAKQLEIAKEAINQALYGMLMIMDGVSGSLTNEQFTVFTETKVKLVDNDHQEAQKEITLSQGDGMCLGFHHWINDDFGNLPVVE